MATYFDFNSHLNYPYPTHPTPHQDEFHTSLYTHTYTQWYNPSLTLPESLVPAPYFWMSPRGDPSNYNPFPEIHQLGGAYSGMYTQPVSTSGSPYYSGTIPESVERTVRRKPPVQGPYSAPPVLAPKPIPPTADVPAPRRSSKKPPTTEKYKHGFTPVPDSHLRIVLCQIASCTSACLGKENLVRHIEAVHGISSRHNNHYRCTFAECRHKDGLVSHMKATHNFAMKKEHITEAVSLVRCPWHGCGNELTPSSFQRHISTHANTTFRCPICLRNRIFARISAYQKHCREEHQDEFIAGRYRYIEEPVRLTD